MIYDPQFPIWRTNHTLKWEGVWRELGCLARTASFTVREESGHSLKSSLSVCVFSISWLCYYTHWYFISDFEYDVFLTARNGHRHTQFYHPSEKRCLTEDQPGLFAILVNERNSSSKNKNTVIIYLFFMVCQELAGYTGGDVRFLKEDFEIQLNKTLFWDSVRCFGKKNIAYVCMLPCF